MYNYFLMRNIKHKGSEKSKFYSNKILRSLNFVGYCTIYMMQNFFFKKNKKKYRPFIV